MAELASAGERFDIVVTDPPAFAKSRKDAEAGLRAYGRLARLAASLVTPSGSCSPRRAAVTRRWMPGRRRIAFGLLRARREGRILFTGGAGPDHPVHAHLPETASSELSCCNYDDRRTVMIGEPRWSDRTI